MLRRVTTENGIIEGLPAADPRVTAFKGIPFAAPPVGALRFHAPRPASSWEGILKAYAFAPISMQTIPGANKDDIYSREWAVDPEIPMSEDCLYLNVWTPANHTEEKLPVFVWYFGGGFQVGNTAEMEFDGERFARRGIVFVSVNYRVNVFGFLAHPELTAENPAQPTNFGLLDQQFGTQWVKRNIAAFGGDPDNITIGGQSAGGGSTMFQIASDQNSGLFQKAIVQSGILTQPYADIIPKHTLAEAEKIGVDFFEFLGVKNLSEARALESSYIMEKWDEYGGFFTSLKLWGPVQDGQFIKDDYMKLFYEGRRQPVPMLLGNTKDEFLVKPVITKKEDFVPLAESLLGSDAYKFLMMIGWPEATFEEMQKASEIHAIEYGIRILCEREDELNSGLKNYYYEFDADIPGWDNPGSFHSVDLWFTFETLAKCWRPFTGKHYNLARKMCNYWSNFIKSGNPNGLDSTDEPMPEWKPYTKAAPCKMLFKDTPITVSTPASPMLSLFIKHYFEQMQNTCK